MIVSLSGNGDVGPVQLYEYEGVPPATTALTPPSAIPVHDASMLSRAIVNSSGSRIITSSDCVHPEASVMLTVKVSAHNKLSDAEVPVLGQE